MRQAIGAVSIPVRDYEEAVEVYSRVLRFDVVEDVPLAGGRRWSFSVRLTPGNAACNLPSADIKGQRLDAGRDGACPFPKLDFCGLHALTATQPRCQPHPPVKEDPPTSHDAVHSRRTFVRNMTLGAALLGSGAAGALAAEIGESTKGGERKLGVALMGLGLYSRGQLGPSLLNTKLCRLAGVVTGSHAKGAKWSRNYGFPEKNIWNYDSIHEIAGNPDIDIVYVVTPNGLHAEHSIRVAEAGKHVICEKPMANSAADCDAMIAACAKAKVKLSIGYRLRFDPHHIELDRLAREKDFGLLNRMSGEYSWTFVERAWRIEKPLSGGGPLMDVGIYVIQAACRGAMAQPVSITARELPKTNPGLFNEVEEAIEWTMVFPGGVTCEGMSSYARNANRFRAEGPKGWIRIEPAFGYGGIEVATSRGRLDIPAVPQQALQMDDFAACILTGRESPVPGSMGRDHMAIIEAIYRSAAEGGRRVEVRPAVA